jgi:hypothetical protein
MEQHKCIDCGYLAVRDIDTRQLEEAERDESGNMVFPRVRRQAWGGILFPKHDAPICFARNSYLQSKYEAKPPQFNLLPAWEAKVRQLLIEEHPCSDFTDWIQGFIPKEHREMIDKKWQRKWNVIVLIVIAVIAGLFTLFNALIIKGII